MRLRMHATDPEKYWSGDSKSFILLLADHLDKAKS